MKVLKNPTNKQKFRQECRQKLGKQRPYFAKKFKVIQELQFIFQQLHPKHILLYMPMLHEIDIRPLFYWLKSMKQRGIKVFIPKVTEISFDSVEFRLQIYKNQYNIYETNASKRAPKIDLMLVPILGIDPTFRRIGFGKGMYDRFYACLKTKPKVIFITKELYFCDEIITRSHDIRGDYLIDCNQVMQRGTHDRYSRYCYYQLNDKRRSLRRSCLFF